MQEITEYKAPTLVELYADTKEATERDQLQAILDSQPKADWVVKHKFISNYHYLPIDKVEFLLKKIFKKYDIEILREGTAFNGVYVVVRVHYMDVLTGEMRFHDGIGAAQLQTASGKSAADLANINNGALSMAFPIAKTVAIKDACDHFGNIFGANLNRKETVSYVVDTKLIEINVEQDRLIRLIEATETLDELLTFEDEVKKMKNKLITKTYKSKYGTF